MMKREIRAAFMVKVNQHFLIDACATNHQAEGKNSDREGKLL